MRAYGDGLSRRQLLVTGSGLAAVALLPGVADAMASAPGARGGAVDEQRHRTLRALLETLAEVPGSPVTPATVQPAMEAFGRRHRAGTDVFRANVDRYIDALHDHLIGSAGIARDPHDRRRRLARCLTGSGCDGAQTQLCRNAVAVVVASLVPDGRHAHDVALLAAAAA